jgi:tRNA (cmo5U34)-methyltransferase
MHCRRGLSTSSYRVLRFITSKAQSKAHLFRRIARKLAPGGRFVLADVVEPVDPSYVVTAIDPEIDHPSKLDEQVAWLEAAGMHPQVTWTHRDLVVIVATLMDGTS